MSSLFARMSEPGPGVGILLWSLLARLRAWLARDTGSTDAGESYQGSELDAGVDPRLASSRAVGGMHLKHEGDEGSTTGSGVTDLYVGRVAGDDLGYAQETGAERRAADAPVDGERS